MTFSPVTWVAGVLDTDRLAQMVENLRSHDHRFAGDHGVPIPRFAVGTLTITPVTNTATYQAVAYPAGRFDPAGPVPQVIVNPSVTATALGSSVLAWGCRAQTLAGFDAWVYRTNTVNTVLSWIAVQAPA